MNGNRPATALVNFHFMSISAHLSYLQKWNYILPTAKLERLRRIVNEILDHGELIEIFNDDFELDESVQYNLNMLRQIFARVSVKISRQHLLKFLNFQINLHNGKHRNLKIGDN